jgi:hypothetical protein
MVLAATLLLLLPPALGADETASASRTVWVLRSSVMGAGGLQGASTGFGMDATLGQPTPVGRGLSTNFGLEAGFWGPPPIATEVPDGTVPAAFRNGLFQNIPNPFNPITTIRYEVGETGPVQVAIYGVQGRLVRMLVDEAQSPGRYEAVWDGRDTAGEGVGSGLYLYRLRVGAYTSVKKMVLIK